MVDMYVEDFGRMLNEMKKWLEVGDWRFVLCIHEDLNGQALRGRQTSTLDYIFQALVATALHCQAREPSFINARF
jgi:hypothetical protein